MAKRHLELVDTETLKSDVRVYMNSTCNPNAEKICEMISNMTFDEITRE